MSNHNHFGMPPGYRHVCMMEGPNPTASLASRRYDALEVENKKHVDEIKRLKALLAAHKIPSEPAISFAIQPPRRSARRSTQVLSKDLPKLPVEIQLRILSNALTCPDPIIDPFYKLNRDTVTKEECPREKFAKEEWRKKQININFLATCKAFHVEGLRVIFANNTFIFTQAPALEDFAKLPVQLRATVKQVTLRVVGRYYDEDAARRDLTGNVPYHNSIDKLMMPIIARPSGMIKDKGIQAYCWEQLADFLRALLMPAPASVFRQKLLPHLDVLRIDLVNFCDHLPYGGYQFGSLIRWHLGQIVDELLITGAPEDDMDDGLTQEERVLHQLVRDEGLVGSAAPQFVSNKSGGLKRLKPNGIAQRLVRGNKIPKSQLASTPIHPEGGEPPKSTFKPGKTIWKWTSDSLANPEKRWIEFHRQSGMPADDIYDDSDMWSDMEE